MKVIRFDSHTDIRSIKLNCTNAQWLIGQMPSIPWHNGSARHGVASGLRSTLSWLLPEMVAIDERSSQLNSVCFQFSGISIFLIWWPTLECSCYLEYAYVVNVCQLNNANSVHAWQFGVHPISLRTQLNRHRHIFVWNVFVWICSLLHCVISRTDPLATVFSPSASFPTCMWGQCLLWEASV